jgi:uncharacterized repeat protein (TIGR01451 family)
VAGQTISPDVTVRATDGIGNTDTNFSGTVTIAILNNPGGGTLSPSPATAVAVNGVATFSNLSINKTGNGYTLRATSGVLTPATSNPFNITPGFASKLQFPLPLSDTQAGATISPAVTVRALDANDNLATGFVGNVSIAILNNPGGGTLSGTLSQPAANGVATFDDLSINMAGNGYTLRATSGVLTPATSTPFDIFPGNAVDIEFVQQPTTTVAGQTIFPAVTVRATDGIGNTDTSFSGTITIAILNNPGGGTLSPSPATATAVNGVATFNNLSIDRTGVGYTLEAQGSGFSDTSDPFDILPGNAVGLEFVQQPTTTASGASITPVVTIRAIDAFGNTDTNFGGNVIVAIDANPSGGTLSGTTIAAAVAGVATFPNLSIDIVGVGYTLIAQATGLDSNTSDPFDVVPGSGFGLEIIQQPTDTNVGATISPAITIRVRDRNNNTVTSFTGAISVAIRTNPGGGSLVGTTTVNAVAGVATFNNLSIDQAGNGYTLIFSSSGFADQISSPFAIISTVGDASGATSTITANPTSIPADGTSTSTITVQLRDANGVSLPTGGDLVTLSTTAGTLNSVTDNNNGTYTATLTSSATTGTATITGTVNGGSIAASATVTFSQVSVGSADLAITAAVSNSNPTLGSTIVYTITVTNRGPDTATGVQVTDALPSRLSLVSAEASQGTFSVATGVWNVGELEPSASATLALTVNVGP